MVKEGGGREREWVEIDSGGFLLGKKEKERGG